MSDKSYKVYFNAVSTEHGNHLFAVGWTSSSGYQPVLERQGETDNFNFDVKKTGDVSAQVITPFQLCVKIPGNPRSINVKVEDNRILVEI